MSSVIDGTWQLLDKHPVQLRSMPSVATPLLNSPEERLAEALFGAVEEGGRNARIQKLPGAVNDG